MFETTIHWVQGVEPHRLGLMARPRGGESLRDEVVAWRIASVDLVVSLLEFDEVRELELKAQPQYCKEEGVAFRHFPIPDRGVPASGTETSILISEIFKMLNERKSVAIHCRAGIGRTGLVAACLGHRLGIARAEIFDLLSRSRGVKMPDTAEQIQWFEKYCTAFPNLL
jgi:protein-tyrosine phosphatase